MDKKAIINFTSFYNEKKSEKKPFDRNDFMDVPLPKKNKVSPKIIEESKNDEVEEIKVEYPEEIVDLVEEPKLDQSFDPPVDPESFVIDDPEVSDKDENENLPSLDNKNNFNKVEENFYPVYKDKFENFTCNVSVEGAKLNKTKARLILESDDWNLVFDGEIDQNGKCTIPIKKLSVLDEGTVGKIRLEVIAENTIFSPWEDEFKVHLSKKVEVQVPKKEMPKEPTVQVKIGE